jgi:peptidylprolyl isomerase
MKKFSNIFIVFLSGLVILLISGCESKHPGYKKTGSGIYYKIHSVDNQDTAQVEIGKIVTLSMKYSANDSLLFDSERMGTPSKFPVQPPMYEGDIYEALTLLKKGDSASLIIGAEGFYTKTVNQPSAPEFIGEDDELVFEIKVLNIQTDAEVQEQERIRREGLKNKEQSIINNYVSENNISVEPNDDGIYFIPKKRGTGKSPEESEWALVHYSVKTLDGNQLFASRERTDEPLEFEVGNRFENEGFQEVVMMMREGGVAEALVPSSMAFGAEGAGDVVDPFTPLYYEIELVDVMTVDEHDRKVKDEQAKQFAEKLKKQEEEKELIDQYLKENNLTVTKELEGGVLYVETQKGEGRKPQRGEKVKVHYTGKLLDGSIFDSSRDRGTPFEFALGRGQVIQGWDLGIAEMNIGTKGKLIIPFEKGYGERGSGDRIPPYSTLVFDVELMDIVEN